MQAVNGYYNCVAWAAGSTDKWWWPDRMEQIYWPPNIPRRVTIEHFVAAFETLGYTPCGDERPEQGFEKVALFAKQGMPTHAARQLPSGKWTSKLGREEDIAHVLDALIGGQYGEIAQVLRRPSPNRTQT